MSWSLESDLQFRWLLLCCCDTISLRDIVSIIAINVQILRRWKSAVVDTVEAGKASGTKYAILNQQVTWQEKPVRAFWSASIKKLWYVLAFYTSFEISWRPVRLQLIVCYYTGTLKKYAEPPDELYADMTSSSVIGGCMLYGRKDPGDIGWFSYQLYACSPDLDSCMILECAWLYARLHVQYILTHIERIVLPNFLGALKKSSNF